MSTKRNQQKAIVSVIIVIVFALAAWALLRIESLVAEQMENTGNAGSMSTPALQTISDAETYEPTTWSAAEDPDAYAVRGQAVVDYDPAPGKYVYTGLDELGRTRAAYACITPADYNREKSEEREEFGADADKLSGWGYNEKVSVTFPNGKTYNGYFYNRSHLIADSLGGDPTRENLITGSRYQNVGQDNKGGMAYCENKARDWLKAADDGEYLYYAVTPAYIGDEAVCRSVFVDMKSSDGDIDEHVEVFNVSGSIDNNLKIDYITGNIMQ